MTIATASARPPNDVTRLRDSTGASTADPPPVTLHSFLTQVASVLRTGLPDRIWLRASVLAVKPRAGGFQLQLGDDAARLDAYLPRRALDSVVAEIGPVDPTLLVGITISLEIAPAFDPRWHLQARVLNLGAETTRSLAAVRIERLRADLKAAGLYDRQRRLVSPLDVTRVALIHPAAAASWADVAAELARWQRAGLMLVASTAVAFEGPRAALAITGALTRAAATAIDGHTPDLIMIIRGGGAKAALAVLDDEPLVRAICLCPVPVVVGVGHASDKSLADEVAWASSDTPSKALMLVRALMMDPARRALSSLDQIARATTLRLVEQATLMERAYGRVLTAGRHAIDPVDQRLAREWSSVRDAIAETIHHLGRERDNAARLLQNIADGGGPAVDRAARDLGERMAAVAALVRRSLLGVDPGGTLVATVVAKAMATIDTQAISIGHALDRAVEAAMVRLASCEADLATAELVVTRHDVQAALEQGYALPLDRQGRLIRSCDAAVAAGTLELLLRDGAVAAVVDPS